MHFREQIDLVLLAAVGFLVAFLASVPAHIRDGHPVNADSLEGFFYFVQLVRLDYRLDLFHMLLPCSCLKGRAPARSFWKFQTAARPMPAATAARGAPMADISHPTSRQAPIKKRHFISTPPRSQTAPQ